MQHRPKHKAQPVLQWNPRGTLLPRAVPPATASGAKTECPTDARGSPPDRSGRDGAAPKSSPRADGLPASFQTPSIGVVPRLRPCCRRPAQDRHLPQPTNVEGSVLRVEGKADLRRI